MVPVVVRPMGFTGRIIGRTVNAMAMMVVWTVSSTIRVVSSPFR